LYSLPVTPLSYSRDTLWIGELSLSLSPDVRPIDVQIVCDSGNRVTLSSGGRPFVLGVCISRGAQGTGGFEFTPDPGDDVSLVINHSILSWPTPFDLNFMTGRSTSWMRDLYYLLVWKKASGANLVMVWRFEQGFYPGDGWTSGTMIRAGSTGLLKADVPGKNRALPQDN
jgi:hypothetical protein